MEEAELEFAEATWGKRLCIELRATQRNDDFAPILRQWWQQRGGIPRLLDIGQCNDAYGAIRIASALAEAFGCGINDLPLSMVLSWYEQKAVCILLTLLYLGVKNIRLGPSLPAFVSPAVLHYLSENFGLAPITTPEADLKQLLGS